MQTPPSSIACFVVAAIIGSVGQYLYKAGAEEAGHTIISYLFNVKLLAGMGCYIAVMVLFVAAFRLGGAMSVLYPIYASTFIWGAIIAWLAFGERISLINMAGMGVLILGMYLMGVGK
jgi:uncharacterized membrane protein